MLNVLSSRASGPHCWIQVGPTEMTGPDRALARAFSIPPLPFIVSSVVNASHSERMSISPLEQV